MSVFLVSSCCCTTQTLKAASGPPRLRWINWVFCALTICLSVCGCGGNVIPNLLTGQNRPFHQKVGWKAKDFFTDAKTIALCEAIEADDLKEIDRLVAAGANVNDRGTGNITPLMWAFPDNKLGRFTRLLEHGADPNVVITTNLNVPTAFIASQSVTILAAGSYFPGYFTAVMEHGGDPNLKGGLIGEPSLHTIITGPAPDKLARIQLALKHGADINLVDSTHCTATVAAVSWGGQYDLALSLLKLGADPNVLDYGGECKLIDTVAIEESIPRSTTGQQGVEFKKLRSWLVDHGQDIEKARREYRERMDNKVPPGWKEEKNHE